MAALLMHSRPFSCMPPKLTDASVGTSSTYSCVAADYKFTHFCLCISPSCFWPLSPTLPRSWAAPQPPNSPACWWPQATPGCLRAAAVSYPLLAQPWELCPCSSLLLTLSASPPPQADLVGLWPWNRWGGTGGAGQVGWEISL